MGGMIELLTEVIRKRGNPTEDCLAKMKVTPPPLSTQLRPPILAPEQSELCNSTVRPIGGRFPQAIDTVIKLSQRFKEK